MDNPLISVIVPTFNRPDWLLLTLQSLRDQSYKNIEVVVVNDAGSDVKEVVEKLDDKRFKYFSHAKNKGLAATRNTAMQHATGEYFSWLDDDDIYLPFALEFRMWKMEQLEADVVYTRALKNIYKPNGNQYQKVQSVLYWDSPFHKDVILVQNIAPCLCPLFSRKAWDKVGNYKLDETLTTSEDQDFWVALSRENHFHELKLVDCECSYRDVQGGQMTGTRDFSKNWITIYKRWRNTASKENFEWVKNTQNQILRNAGIKPEDHGL